MHVNGNVFLLVDVFTDFLQLELEENGLVHNPNPQKVRPIPKERNQESLIP